jgi:hypothetical protein
MRGAVIVELMFVIAKLLIVAVLLLYVVVATEGFGYPLSARLFLAPALTLGRVLDAVSPSSWMVSIVSVALEHPLGFTIAIAVLALAMWCAIWGFIFG